MLPVVPEMGINIGVIDKPVELPAYRRVVLQYSVYQTVFGGVSGTLLFMGTRGDCQCCFSEKFFGSFLKSQICKMRLAMVGDSLLLFTLFYRINLPANFIRVHNYTILNSDMMLNTWCEPIYISIGLPDSDCTVPPSRYAPYSDIEKKLCQVGNKLANAPALLDELCSKLK